MSRSQRMLERMHERLASTGKVSRADLKIVDYKSIQDKRVGSVLISYDRDLPVPTAHDLNMFFVENFGNLVQANFSTLRTHQDDFAVSVTAQTYMQTRPINDAADRSAFRMANPLTYIETGTNALWNVTQDESGRKFMVRHSDENLDELIEARKQRVNRSAPKLAEVKTSAVLCDKGDRVQFYDAGVISTGEVLECGKKLVKLQTSNGTVSVDPGALIKITYKSQQAIASEKDMLSDYFAKAYGDKKFSDELTRTLVVEENKGKINT